MNFIDFSIQFRGFPVFSILDIEKRFPGFERENLLNWQKKGFLLRIRNGWYSFSDAIQTEEQAWYTANKIYTPSYISLASALSHYGWIPEGVFSFTSVSTRKTCVFETPKGRFQYFTVKPALFFGYKIQPVEGLGIKIAEPEKALLDFLYFHPKLQLDVDFESFRFNLPQMHVDLDIDKLDAYAGLFSSDALLKRLNTFKNILEHAEYF